MSEDQADSPTGDPETTIQAPSPIHSSNEPLEAPRSASTMPSGSEPGLERHNSACAHEDDDHDASQSDA